jgi:hypothetical protein
MFIGMSSLRDQSPPVRLADALLATAWECKLGQDEATILPKILHCGSILKED